MVRAAETQGVRLDDCVRLSRFLLLQDATDLNVMQRVTVWLKSVNLRQAERDTSRIFQNK